MSEENNEVIKGGPGMEGDTPVPDPAPVVPAPTVPAPTVYKTGFQDFSSADDLATYARGLESQLANKPKEVEAAQPLDEVITPVATGKEPLADMMFTNPQGFIDTLKGQIKADNDSARAEEKKGTDFWDSFYKKNPDLLKNKWVVDSVVDKRWDELKTQPTEYAEAEIVKDARAKILSVAGSTGARQVKLEAGMGDTLGGTGESAPVVESVSAPQTFVEEMTSFQRK